MRSNPIDRWRYFRFDVDREITFLVNCYGEQAYRAALAAAARPNLRSRRRRVLKAVARALNPAPTLLWVFRLPAGKLARTQVSARAVKSAPSRS